MWVADLPGRGIVAGAALLTYKSNQGVGGSAVRRPVVGVTGYSVGAQKSRELGFGPRYLDITPGTYLGWVRDCGMLPVPIPVHSEQLHDDYLSMLDGLLLTGGADIGPELYGAPAHPLAKLEPHRDAFEFGLVRAAFERGLPILGICRGMQVLNVALGGSMHQHLPERSEELVHSSEFRDGRRHPDDMWQPAYHQVTITDPTLAALAGADQISTNSYHHQGVAALGEGLSIAARASDGLVEAVVGVDRPLLGVQWHPEMHTATDQAGIAPFRWLANRLTTGVAADEVLALN
jgi:putative glutamine amidotransferase